VNNNDRIANTLTMNGGEFVVIGNAAANTNEALGALNLASGYSTITLSPNAARNTRVTFRFARAVARRDGVVPRHEPRREYRCLADGQQLKHRVHCGAHPDGRRRECGNEYRQHRRRGDRGG
jgi:hypothetical protein